MLLLVVKHDWATMRQAIQDHIGSLNWGYRVALRDKNVKYLNAYGEFVGQHTIKVTAVKSNSSNSRSINNAFFLLFFYYFLRFPLKLSLQTTTKSGKVQEITSNNFLIATGGRPNYPDIPGIEHCITRYKPTHSLRFASTVELKV